MPSAKVLSQQRGAMTKETIEKKKKQQEQMNALQPLTDEPPEWLDDTAKDEYYRIYPLLQELPIADLDLALVCTYCQTYSNYINACKKLATQDMVVETERGTKLNQYYTVQRDSLNSLNAIAPKLGLSVDSRLKIFSPKDTKTEKKDKFSDLFKE